MHPFFRNSLRGRLLVLVILVAGSLCVLAGVLIWNAYRNERAAVFRELVGSARATASLVDQRVENLESLLKGLVAVGELESGNLEAFYERAAKLTKPGHRWVVVVALDGRQVINTHAPFGAPLPDVAMSPELMEALVNGRTYISNLSESRVAGRPALFVSTGILIDGRLRYRASLAVSPEEFSAGTVIADTPPGQVIAVIDRHDVIVARSEGQERYVGKRATTQIVEAAKLRRETILYSCTLDGRDVLAAVVPAERSGWNVVIGAPTSFLWNSTWRMIVVGVLTSLAILAAATAVAWWIVWAAVHDVTDLMADTRAVGAGRLPGPSNTMLTETRAIAAALRATAAQLRNELDERLRAQTELEATQEELSMVNRDLERKVRERTASLAELVDQLEEFTYSISHDLRAPVLGTVGLGRAILEDHPEQLGPDARELLERIVAAGGRMDAMINDLLDFSRVNRQEVELVPVSLDAVVANCVRGHPTLSQHADNIMIEGPLPVVRGHAPSLQHAITNLLTNAVKFVAPGVTPRVRVSVEERGELVRLWVSDNGIGISPALQGKLFRVFERLHVRAGYEGTGIGLAIVRRALERMEGAVGLESDGCAGSRFWIELRRATPGDGMEEAVESCTEAG